MIEIKIDTSAMQADIKRFATLSERAIETAQQRALIGTARATHAETGNPFPEASRA